MVSLINCSQGYVLYFIKVHTVLLFRSCYISLESMEHWSVSSFTNRPTLTDWTLQALNRNISAITLNFLIRLTANSVFLLSLKSHGTRVLQSIPWKLFRRTDRRGSTNMISPSSALIELKCVLPQKNIFISDYSTQ